MGLPAAIRVVPARLRGPARLDRFAFARCMPDALARSQGQRAIRRASRGARVGVGPACKPGIRSVPRGTSPGHPIPAADQHPSRVRSMVCPISPERVAFWHPQPPRLCGVQTRTSDAMNLFPSPNAPTTATQTASRAHHPTRTLRRSRLVATLLGACLGTAVIGSGCRTETRSLAHEVDPFIGTGGHGHTYPGATSPFGMVQLSPDTRLEGWDG